MSQGPQPNRGRTCDTVVVGAGITGLTAAVRFQELGADTLLLDMNGLGSGATNHSNGQLDFFGGDLLQQLVARFGLDAAWRILAIRRNAVRSIAERCSQLGLKKNFKNIPTYLFATGRADQACLEFEYKIARRLNVPAIRMDRAPLPFPVQGALKFPEQAHFFPGPYLVQLARLFASRGGRLLGHTRVENVEEFGDRVLLATSRGTIRARQAVIAVHSPLLGSGKLRSVQCLNLALRIQQEIPDAYYRSLGRSRHFIHRSRSDDSRSLVIGGTGSDFDGLEKWVRGWFRVENVEQRWSAPRFQTWDGLPSVGRVNGFKQVYQATGFGQDGLTWGTVAGLLLPDLAAGRPVPGAKFFNPGRLRWPQAGQRLIQSVRRTASWLGRVRE